MQIRRDLIYRNPGAIAQPGVENLVEEDLTGAVINLGRLELLLLRLDPARVGQVFSEVGIYTNHRADAYNAKQSDSEKDDSHQANKQAQEQAIVLLFTPMQNVSLGVDIHLCLNPVAVHSEST